VKVLSAFEDQAVFEVKNSAAAGIQAFAVPFPAIVMDCHDAAVRALQHLFQTQAECSAGLARILGEQSEYGIATKGFSRNRTPARYVPGRIPMEELGQRREIIRVERRKG